MSTSTLLAAVLVWIARTRRHDAIGLWRATALAVGAYVLLVPTAMHPWYVLWVVPFLLLPALRPEPGGEFDPAMAGERWIPVLLGLRLFGYALVTPIFEELFIRSFVLRIADVWETEHDFRDQPIARYSALSLVVSTVVFTAGHQFWEYWVCVPWIVLSTLWFYHRRNLTALMVVHGVTNGALLALAVFGEGWLRDVDGTPFSFWFFV